MARLQAVVGPRGLRGRQAPSRAQPGHLAARHRTIQQVSSSSCRARFVQLSALTRTLEIWRFLFRAKQEILLEICLFS